MFYCYVLKSLKSGKYYIGSTKDISNRLLQHNKGLSYSTRRECPWELIYQEDFNDLKMARKREFQLKGWKSRSAIEKLIRSRILDPDALHRGSGHGTKILDEDEFKKML